MSQGPVRLIWGFWTTPIRAESLAMFRILLGLTILGSVVTGIGSSLTYTCGPDGACPAEANDERLRRSGRICLLRGPVSLPVVTDWLPAWFAEEQPTLHCLLSPEWARLSPESARAWADWGARPSSAYLLFGLFVLSLVTMTLGLCTRLSTLAAVLLAATFHHRLPWLMNGGDSLFRNGLYFLLLSPAGAVWSLDRWLWDKLRGRPEGPVFIAPWSVRLMQVQVCAMYLFTGLMKLGDDYLDGQALYWVLNDVALCRWPYSRLPVPFVVCQLLSWGTLAFEIGFSVLILIRPLRRWLLLAGLSFHLGILVVMEIGWFSPVTMCWYVLFVPGEQVSAFVQRLRQRCFGGREEATPRIASASPEATAA
jgi:hypothetical protein